MLFDMATSLMPNSLFFFASLYDGPPVRRGIRRTGSPSYPLRFRRATDFQLWFDARLYLTREQSRLDMILNVNHNPNPFLAPVG